MHHEDLFKSLVGKYDLQFQISITCSGKDDEVSDYDTHPVHLATYDEILNLVSQAKYEEGQLLQHN